MTCAECHELLTTIDVASMGVTGVGTVRPRTGPAATEPDPRPGVERDPGTGSTPASSDAPARRPAELQAHLATCERCASAAALVATADRTLAAVLAGDAARRPASAVAAHAWATVHRAWYRRWLTAALCLTAVALVWLLAWVLVVPELRRLTAAPPPVVTETFSLACLSPEQAASIIRPYLPAPENPRWQAERFDVVPARGGIRAITVRAPHEVIARVPAVLSRFERDADAACRAPRGATTRR